MKTILYVVAGLAIVIVVLVGGSIAWVATKKMDVNSPAFAAKFGEKLQKDCTDWAMNRISYEDQTADYQRVALIKQVCACNAKELMRILKRNEGMTAIEMGKAIEAHAQEMNAAFKSCSLAYGVKGITGEPWSQ
jgi:hypothetical protein